MRIDVHGSSPVRLTAGVQLSRVFEKRCRGAVSGGRANDQMRSNAETAVSIRRRRATMMVAKVVMAAHAYP
jgi:hypothetical protein